MSFRDNYEATVKFLNEFRDETLKPRRFRHFVHVDLEPVEYISVPVAIVVAAEFHRWSLMKGRLRVRSAEKWSPQVRNLLSDLGVFELLNLPTLSEEFAEGNVTLTKLQSGIKLDGRKIDRLQAAFQSTLHGLTKDPNLYAGLTEAAENAIIHAYPEDYVPRHPFAGHRWWGAGCIDINGMLLRFFIFDQGAGIPHTLPANDWYETIRAVIAKYAGEAVPNDSLMLRAAMEAGRSRTGEAHRGRGLKKMADVIDQAERSYLRIVSGKGEVVYSHGDKVNTYDHQSSIGGTLIEWCLPATALMGDAE